MSVSHPLPPRAGATLLVAASNAAETTRDRADFVCTGTNDQVTIATAIGSLPMDGEDRRGTVVLSEGDFSLSGTILVPGHVQLIGSGWGTKLLATSGMNQYMLSLLPHTLTATIAQGAEGVRISNLFMDHNAATQTGGGCIDAYGARLCLFDHLHLSRSFAAGIQLRGLPNGNVAGENVVAFCTIDGGSASPDNGCALVCVNNTRNSITNCTFVGAAGAGGNTTNADPCTISDQAGENTYSQNVFSGGAIGLHAATQTGIELLGNTFENGTNSAVLLSAGSNNILTGNVFTNTTAATVISVTGGTAYVLTGNTWVNTTGVALTADGNNHTISSNTFTTTSGTVIVATGSNHVITGNTFSGSGGTLLTVTGSSYAITGNLFTAPGASNSAIYAPTSLTQSVITGNVFTTGGNSLPNYLHLIGSSQNIVEQNIFSPGGPSPAISLPSDSGSIVRHNIGFVTEQSGTGYIGGATSVTISHNIDASITMGTQYIHVSPYQFTGGTRFWITTNPGTFTVNTDVTSTMGFGWQIQIF